MDDYEPGRRCESCGCESPSAPVCGACEIDERAAAQIDAIEKERDTAIARAEAAEAELCAIREEVRADPAARTVDAVAALFASARCSVAEARREAERLRHGVPIEGDMVSPNELRATAAEADARRLAAEAATLRAALDVAQRHIYETRHGVPVCVRCGMIRCNPPKPCRGYLPTVKTRGAAK